MNLNFEYQSDDITDDEFQNELNGNQDKYYIEVSLLRNQSDLDIITEIVGRINDELTVDDISDLFSIDINTIPKLIQPSI